MKNLTLIRHAKSSWKDPSLIDLDGPLSKRGKRDAPVMGRPLAERASSPDLMISSPATRALVTTQVLTTQVRRTWRVRCTSLENQEIRTL